MLSRQTGDRLQAGTLLSNLSDYELWTGDLDAARRHLTESLDIARERWSARLNGAADQALAALGHTFQPLEARLADLNRQHLRAAIGAEAFETEYAVGRTLDLAQLLAAVSRKDTSTEQARADASGEATTVLTPRELDVLALVAQGLSNPDIARRLVLSEHTVHLHLANILRKLNLSSRAAAAALAVRSGLI